MGSFCNLLWLAADSRRQVCFGKHDIPKCLPLIFPSAWVNTMLFSIKKKSHNTLLNVSFQCRKNCTGCVPLSVPHRALILELQKPGIHSV